MGGYGSGGWNRKYKGTVESARRLDITMLRRSGVLDGNEPRTITWSTNGMVHLSLTLLHIDGRLLIGDATARDATARDATARGAAGRDPLAQYLQLRNSPSSVGGKRVMFECGSCGARRQHLYLHGHRFVCRDCAGLTYQAQRERDVMRAHRRWDRVSAALGGVRWADRRLAKPKHMHWRTYEALVERLRVEEDYVDAELMASLRQA